MAVLLNAGPSRGIGIRTHSRCAVLLTVVSNDVASAAYAHANQSADLYRDSPASVEVRLGGSSRRFRPLGIAQLDLCYQ